MTIDPHWDEAARLMLQALGGDAAEQGHVLYEDRASLRAALKGKCEGRFDRMGDPEFIAVVSYARAVVERDRVGRGRGAP